MLESNPPRNSRPPTQQDDEAGGEAESRPAPGKDPPPHRIDRSAYALENSLRKLPRSGLLFSIRGEADFECDGRQVAQCGVQSALVVDLLQKVPDRAAGLLDVAVLLQ